MNQIHYGVKQKEDGKLYPCIKLQGSVGSIVFVAEQPFKDGLSEEKIRASIKHLADVIKLTSQDSPLYPGTEQDSENLKEFVREAEEKDKGC